MNAITHEIAKLSLALNKSKIKSAEQSDDTKKKWKVISRNMCSIRLIGQSSCALYIPLIKGLHSSIQLLPVPKNITHIVVFYRQQMSVKSIYRVTLTRRIILGIKNLPSICLNFHIITCCIHLRTSRGLALCITLRVTDNLLGICDILTFRMGTL